MSKQEIVDARGGDYAIAEGSVLRKMIRNRIVSHQDSLKRLYERMNNEIESKEKAVALMVALSSPAIKTLNEQALFFKACVERAHFLENEIADLNSVGPTFADNVSYRLSLADLRRYGIG